MSEDELRKELQQISSELQQYDEFGKQIQIQIEKLQNYLIDLTRSKGTLAGLKEEKNIEETLIPLGSGVMLKAKPLETDKVFYSVGADVIVPKSIDEAIKDIDGRINEAEEQRINLADQLNQIISRISSLEQHAQGIYKQLQGPSKPQYDPNLVS